MEDVSTSTKLVKNFSNGRVLSASKVSGGWEVVYGNADLSRIYRKSANGIMIPATVPTKKELNALVASLDF